MSKAKTNKKPAPKKAVKKKPAQTVVKKDETPSPLPPAAVKEVMEQVMLASPVPNVEADDDDTRKRAQDVKAAQAAELKRLEKLGLVEVEVRGSPYKLVGLADPGKEATIEQRVEISKRINAVGPLLPRFVQSVKKAEQPQPTPPEGGAMPKKGSGIEGVTVSEIETAHAENLKELDSIERDREKRKKAEEKKRKEKEKLQAVAARRKNVAPKVVVKDDEPAKSSTKKGKPAAAKPAAKGKAVKPVAVPSGGFNKSNVPATSGELIRARIAEHKLTDEQIADEVRKLFPGRNTKVSDVRWNRGQMRKHGVDAPDPVGEAPQPKKGKK